MPVKTMRASRGRSRPTFLRLCSRAPRTTRRPDPPCGLLGGMDTHLKRRACNFPSRDSDPSSSGPVDRSSQALPQGNLGGPAEDVGCLADIRPSDLGIVYRPGMELDLRPSADHVP